MFDFAWTEIALIAVVALIAIGPKDLPVAIKALTEVIKKGRRMAAEFQTHVDEMVREANLGEVRDQINQIRNLDIKGEIERAVDADGSLRTTFASNPLADAINSGTTGSSTLSGASVGEHPATIVQTPGDVDLLTRPADVDTDVAAQVTTEQDGAATKAEAAVEIAPAFIPPALVSSPAPPTAPLTIAEAPAFIPPAFAKRPLGH